MIVLGIETSGLLCSVAWYHDNQTLLEYNIEKPQIHASCLAAFIKTGLKYLNLSSQDISLVAVATGPGSYTGLRIGMGYTKGFCYGLNIPIVGISNFDVLLFQAPNLAKSFITLINANRGRFYYARFNNKNEKNVEQGVISESDIDKWGNEGLGLVTDYYTEINSKSKPWKDFLWIHKARFNSSVLCEIAEKRYKTVGADELNQIEPLYLQAFAGVL